MSKLKIVLICLFSFLLGLGKIVGNDGINLIDYINILLLGMLLLIHVFQNPRVLGEYFKLDFFLVLFVFIIMSISQAVYGDSSYTKEIFNFQYLFLIIIYVILKNNFINSEKQLVYSLGFFCFGVAALVFYGLLAGGVIYKGQLMVFGQNPNSTSSRVLISLVVMLYCLFFIKNFGKFAKIIIFIISIMMLVFLIKTGSRGSLLSLVFSVAFLLFFANINFKYKLQFLFFLVIAFISFFFYLENNPLLMQRWGSVLEGDTAGRTDIWLDAYSIFLKNPLIGVGEAGYFQEIFYKSGSYIDTHNLFIYIAVTGGVLSLIAFLYFIFLIIKNSLFKMAGIKLLSFLLMANIIIIISKTGGSLTYFIMWYIFSICSAINNKKYIAK